MGHISRFKKIVASLIGRRPTLLNKRQFTGHDISNSGSNVLVFACISPRCNSYLVDPQFVLAVEFSQMTGNHLLVIDFGCYTLPLHFLLSRRVTRYVEQRYTEHQSKSFLRLLLPGLCAGKNPSDGLVVDQLAALVKGERSGEFPDVGRVADEASVRSPRVNLVGRRLHGERGRPVLSEV